MNVLYIAYSCDPYQGSEDKIGWKIPLESAKFNQVYVITKEEQRPFVERYLKEHPQKNLHFFYVDIPACFKKIYKGFLYSGRLHIWHRYALPVAKRICQQFDIEIVHQITPVEFRAVGNYGLIPNIRFVCGPIAGGQKIPRELIGYAGRHIPAEWLRSSVNSWFRLRYKVNGRLKHCDSLFFANTETRDYLKNVTAEKDRENLLPDVSVDEIFSRDKCAEDSGNRIRFLTVARLVYLKGHSLLLDALARIPDTADYACVIVGDGPEEKSLQKNVRTLGLSDHVIFAGAVPHHEIGKFYDAADVFVFPSLREATGTVLAEAISHGLPVIALNQCGGKLLLDDSMGWLVGGTGREVYVENLKEALMACISRPDEVSERGKNAHIRAKDFLWEKRVQYFQSVYNKLLET